MLDITIKILILLQENMSKWTNVNGRHIYMFRGKEKQMTIKFINETLCLFAQPEMNLNLKVYI